MICGGAAFVALGACSGGAPTAAPDKADIAVKGTDPAPSAAPVMADVKESPALAVEAEGLRLFNKQSGSARPIAFGTPREDVIQLLAFRGKPETGQNGECGAGPLDFANWPDGFGLFFQNDKFVGWNLNSSGKPAVTTASGIGVGSSRAELESAYAAKISETSLGTEFAAGELYGILDGPGQSATITNMWGGLSCNFR